MTMWGKTSRETPNRISRLIVTTGVIAISMAAGSGARAQSAGAEPKEGAETADIVVTGSRLAKEGFDLPAPTKVLSSELLQQRGATNVGDFLNEIPAFRPSTNAQASTTSSTGQVGQVYADLRALGNIRTLTLVDGRRFVPSASTGQVDLNLIPTILVDRVEVVTGGVSAAYGSDAISGVVNVILNKNLQGFKGDISAGISNYGDNFEQRYGLGFGTEFNNDRGHIVIGGEYVKSDGVGPFTARDWGARNDEIVTFPVNRPAGTPSRAYAPGVRQTNAPLGGVVNGACATVNCTPTPLALTSPLRGIGFGPGGSVQPFNYGNDTLNTGNATNFTSPDGAPSRYGILIALPIERYSTAVHLDYDLTDSISVFLDGNYASSGSNFNAAYPRDQNTTNLIIRRDNAYLPAQLAQRMDANGVTAVSLARSAADYNRSAPEARNTTERVVAGFSGTLFKGWDFDAYYEYGRNRFNVRVGPIRIESNYRFAQDAVYYNSSLNQILADPSSGVPAGYQITCRALVPGSTTYNPIAAVGCVPMNLFGFDAPSAASRNYVNGTVIQEITTTQQVAAANLRGDLFNTWAGPVSVAIGGEYRKESARSVVDDLSRRRAFNYSNPQPYQGGLSVKEVYAEALVPLAEDLPFAKSLELNGAVRYTNYSTSGSVTTWKIGATWAPVDGFKLRGTASRDIRAPNSSELFQNTQTTTLAINPFTGTNSAYTVFTLPSPTLQPEKADSRTVGMVLSPGFVPGLNLSVDYYHINVKGSISSYGASFITSNCVAEVASPTGPGFFCGFFDRTGTSINSLSLQLVNIASITSSGIDFDIVYRRPVGADGSITARLFSTWIQHLTTDDGLGIARTYNAAGVLTSKGSVVDRAGQVGASGFGIVTGATEVPHWTHNASLTYASERWSATLNGRYVGGGKIDKRLVAPGDRDYNSTSPISIDNNDIDGRFYLSLSGTFDILSEGNRKLQAYAIVNNLANIDPPFPTTAASGLYDRIGRYFRFGLRFSY